MANNKITIGDGKAKKKNESISRLTLEKQEIIEPIIEPEIEEIPIDENVWGNDSSVIKRLDEEQLVERRLFVRIIFMRQIKCYETLNNLQAESILLSQPIEFSITDISIGGIGIISDYEIKAGNILLFNLILDDNGYDIKCEVLYCFKSDDKFRGGLRILNKDKDFIRHLKIVVARVSLRNRYS
jgi:hypothetical protein